MTKLHVVMPIFGQWDLVKGALDSLDGSTGCEDIELHLHTIDTAGPKIPQELLEHFGAAFSPDWTHTVLDKNPGVTAPWNLGVKVGIERGADVFCITNSDVVFGKTVVQRCVEAALKYGCAIPHCTPAGSLPVDFWKQDEEVSRLPDAVKDGFCGWCFFLSRKTIEDVGIFDGQYTLWYQDAQYHWRLARAGVRPVKVMNCLLHHYESKTILSMPGRFEVNGWRAADAVKWDAWTKWWTQKCADPNWNPTATFYKPEQFTKQAAYDMENTPD